MMNTNPVILRIKKSRYIRSLSVSFPFVILGLKMFKTLPLLSIIILIVFGISSLLSLIPFFSAEGYLKLDSAGFTFRSMFKTTTVHWNEVSNLGIEKNYSGQKVRYNLHRNLYDYRSYIDCANLTESKKILPDNYGMNPQKLVRLMENYREKYVWSNN